jgi:hypothetical protein
MKKRTLSYALVPVLAASAFCGTLSVQPANQSVNSGQSFSVTVNATATDLFAFQLDLTFNPSVLSATSVTEGSFLSAAGTTAFLPGSIDNAGGTISFNADSLIGPVPGVTGSGSLLTVRFTGIHAGASAIDLTNVTLLDSSLSNISVTTVDGSAMVLGTSSVPEPSSSALCLAVLCGLGLIGSGRRSASKQNELEV